MRKLLAAALALAVGACSGAPLPVRRVIDFQSEVQSSSHWPILAESAADRLQSRLLGLPAGSAYYVEPHAGQGSFGDVFGQTLAEDLAGQGVRIVYRRADADYEIRYGTRLVDHAFDKKPPGGTLTLLAAGLWGLTETLAATRAARDVTTGVAGLATGAFLDTIVATWPDDDLAEYTVSLAVLGPNGAVATDIMTFYVSRENAHLYPELPLPALYAAAGRGLPEPSVRVFDIRN